jgi:hypothetical protein
LGGGALTIALAQETKPGDPFREYWLAHGRLRVSEARSTSRTGIFTACTDAAAEAAEAAAAEAAAAEAAAAVEAATAAEAAAAAGAAAAAKTAADAPGARVALAPELPKERGGGAGGMAEDAEETPGRPVFSVAAQRSTNSRQVAQQ